MPQLLHSRLMLSGRSIVLLLLALPTLGLYASGCAVVIGNVRPEDQKSDSYGVADLTKTNPDWVRLDPKKGDGSDNYDPNTTPTEVSDVAYQSKATSSVISLNSACRPNREVPEGRTIPEDLRALTDVLLLGASKVTLRTETSLTLQSSPALETTIMGLINGETVEIRAVVLRRRTCIYDLLYVSRPVSFAAHEPEFSQFVASLRLK
jgi:hypothetical protein